MCNYIYNNLSKIALKQSEKLTIVFTQNWFYNELLKTLFIQILDMKYILFTQISFGECNY